MFFIVNHENSIIAADADFLEEIGADSVYEAALLIKNGEVALDELEHAISYLQKTGSFSKTALSTFLGDAFLYQIHDEVQEEEQEQVEALSMEDPLFDLADPEEESISEEVESLISDIEEEEFLDLTSTDTLETKEETLEKILEENEDSALPEVIGLVGAGAAVSTLLDQEEDAEEVAKIDLEISDEPLILLKESKEEATFSSEESDIALSLLDEEDDLDTSALREEETEEKTEEEPQEDKVATEGQKVQVANTHINITEISELIGVSEEEYTHFLSDFQKESSMLESHLRSNDLKESREAISTLKEASLLLHLPHITEKLEELSNATSGEKEEIINSFLKTVSQTTGTTDDKMPLIDISDTPDEIPAKTGTIEEEEEILSIMPAIEEEETLPANEAIVLDDIQAIPFDFSINEAADELTLPASLVSEFIIDFINQAKENIPVLQKAYDEKDMDKIQKTAHMLKGASSNLRIAPMADTLYHLQFNDTLEKVPELIRLFTGQLKALSIQMDQE